MHVDRRPKSRPTRFSSHTANHNHRGGRSRGRNHYRRRHAQQLVPDHQRNHRIDGRPASGQRDSNHIHNPLDQRPAGTVQRHRHPRKPAIRNTGATIQHRHLRIRIKQPIRWPQSDNPSDPGKPSLARNRHAKHIRLCPTRTTIRRNAAQNTIHNLRHTRHVNPNRQSQHKQPNRRRWNPSKQPRFPERPQRRHLVALAATHTSKPTEAPTRTNDNATAAMEPPNPKPMAPPEKHPGNGDDPATKQATRRSKTMTPNLYGEELEYGTHEAASLMGFSTNHPNYYGQRRTGYHGKYIRHLITTGKLKAHKAPPRRTQPPRPLPMADH